MGDFEDSRHRRRLSQGGDPLKMPALAAAESVENKKPRNAAFATIVRYQRGENPDDLDLDSDGLDGDGGFGIRRATENVLEHYKRRRSPIRLERHTSLPAFGTHIDTTGTGSNASRHSGTRDAAGDADEEVYDIDIDELLGEKSGAAVTPTSDSDEEIEMTLQQYQKMQDEEDAVFKFLRHCEEEGMLARKSMMKLLLPKHNKGQLQLNGRFNGTAALKSLSKLLNLGRQKELKDAMVESELESDTDAQDNLRTQKPFRPQPNTVSTLRRTLTRAPSESKISQRNATVVAAAAAGRARLRQRTESKQGSPRGRRQSVGFGKRRPRQRPGTATGGHSPQRGKGKKRGEAFETKTLAELELEEQEQRRKAKEAAKLARQRALQKAEEEANRKDDAEMRELVLGSVTRLQVHDHQLQKSSALIVCGLISNSERLVSISLQIRSLGQLEASKSLAPTTQSTGHYPLDRKRGAGSPGAADGRPRSQADCCA